MFKYMTQTHYVHLSEHNSSLFLISVLTSQQIYSLTHSFNQHRNMILQSVLSRAIITSNIIFSTFHMGVNIQPKFTKSIQ